MNTAPSQSSHRIVNAVLTGGPCAGKSTAIVACRDHLESLGWRVIVIPETATHLIGAGIVPFNGNAEAFQRALFPLQIAVETEARRYAHTLGRDVLLLHDRGLMDNAAYVSGDMFNRLLEEFHLTRFCASGRYDAVLHLVTAAKGARDYYTLANNTARTETPEQAAALDDKILEAWVGHSRLRVIGNHGNFADKVNRVIAEVCALLGLPEPIERERKFLVRILSMPPDVSASRVEIVQSYLNGAAGQEVRVRRRGQGADSSWTETVKRPVPGDPAARYETERHIVAPEYWRMRTMAVAEISKDRFYCAHLSRKSGVTHYLEVDRYDRSSLASEFLSSHAPDYDWATVEVETDITGPIDLPDWMELVEEVTGREEWSNRRMAAPL